MATEKPSTEGGRTKEWTNSITTEHMKIDTIFRALSLPFIVSIRHQMVFKMRRDTIIEFNLESINLIYVDEIQYAYNNAGSFLHIKLCCKWAAVEWASKRNEQRWNRWKKTKKMKNNEMKKKNGKALHQIWYKIKRNKITLAAIHSTIIWAYFAYHILFSRRFFDVLKSTRIIVIR